MLRDEDKKAIKKELGSLSGPVKLVNFTQELECQYCRDTTSLVQEIAGLSDKITSEVYNFITDKEATEKYKIDKIPATVFMNGEDRGLKYYGVPSGYEFITFLEAVKTISADNSGLSVTTKDFLKSLTKPVHLQVFVTPTCPHCPRAAIIALKMAFESPMVTADIIEAIEFPQLAMKYSVQGVPKTVINDTIDLEGGVPEQMFVDAIKEAIS